MLTRFLFLVAVALIAQSAQAQKAEVEFGVSGVCGMCKNRIEAAFDQKGIVAADYDLKEVTRLIPQCKEVCFEGCNHWLYLEQPQHFVSEVESFLLSLKS